MNKLFFKIWIGRKKERREGGSLYVIDKKWMSNNGLGIVVGIGVMDVNGKLVLFFRGL